MKVALIVALLAIGASAKGIREKRQWFGGFGWPSAVVQPVTHTTSVQQPVVTQEVQQPVYQTQYAAPIVQNHETVVETPVYKQVQHTVGVPTPVIDPVVVAPKVIVPKPSTTKISVIQRVKRQWFGFGGWGVPSVATAAVAAPAVAAVTAAPAVAVAAPAVATVTAVPSVAVAPAVNVHTNIVNPPIVNTVVRPVVHTQVVQPVVHTQSTVYKPVVHEVHSNVYVPEYVHIKPTIIEPVVESVVPAKSADTKISVIQRAKRHAEESKISVIQKRQVLFGGYPSFFGGVYPGYAYTAPFAAVAPAVVVPKAPQDTKISVIQRA